MTEVPDSSTTVTAPAIGDEGDSGAEPAGDVIELSVPAASAYVSVLRSTAAALAARLDFTLDEIEDLRIAVDEASSLLLAQATPGSPLICRFRLSGRILTVSVSVAARQPKAPARDSFAWTVLTALAGSVEADVDASAQRTTLTMAKQAEAVDAGVRSFGGDVHNLEQARHARGGTTD